MSAAPPIERFLRVRAASLAGLLPGGDIAYVSDLTGIAQLWIAREDGLHDQLTFDDERVTGALPSPHDPCVVIARDRGGDERHALVRLDVAYGAELPLTANPEAIHELGAFSPDGRMLAFTHTGRNGTDFDLAVVGLDGTGRRELGGPGGYSAVCDWSEAGILVLRLRSAFDHDLFLADPASGELRHLTPHERETCYEPARLLADGRVLCASDAGSEHARLAVLDVQGGLEHLTPDDADVDSLALDRTRRRRVWTVNREGYGELWLDGRRLEGLPAGVLGPPAIDAPPALDAQGGVVLTLAPADDSVDVWSLPGPVRRTRSPAGGLDRGALARPSLRSFESFDGLAVPYLLFGEPGAPTVCHVHGGPESQVRPQFHPIIQYLCAQGFCVAAPNVRGSTGYGRTYHHLDDVEKRLDSVRDLCVLAEQLGAGRGTPVAVMGGSYGGYMTLAAITERPELWAAAVSTVGIVNFVTFLERTGSYRRALREAEYGSLERDRDFLERISPIRKVDLIQAPLMVIHGANDPRVPISEADQLVWALRERSHPVEYLRYEDEGHGIKRLRNQLECYPRVAAFLDRHLRGA
jgi:dipeptidyl aminopeptidase/acylaminoacyl peptidase